jgi:hypothetical protein
MFVEVIPAAEVLPPDDVGKVKVELFKNVPGV